MTTMKALKRNGYLAKSNLWIDDVLFELRHTEREPVSRCGDEVLLFTLEWAA